MSPDASHAWLHYTIPVSSDLRDSVKDHLQDRNIESSVLYPQDLHLLNSYREMFGHKPGDFPFAECATSEVLRPPDRPGITVEQIDYIATEVTSFVGRRAA